MKNIFFLSSLPRSGATTLLNILAQNPDMHVSSVSGLVEMLNGAKDKLKLPEFFFQDGKTNSSQLTGFCEAAVQGFYKDVDKKYIIDKNKKWGMYRNFVDTFYPNPKIVYIIRDLREVIASMEKQFRRNQAITDSIRIPDEMKGTNLPKRVDIWMANTTLGLALESLNDIVRQGYDDKILFVKYEDLCLYPESELTRIYQYLEIPHFDHDFDSITKVVKEDDEIYSGFQADELGSIFKLQRKPYDFRLVLGADVADWIHQNFKWFFDKFNYKK